MSSSLSSPFMAESIAEVVPDVAKVGGRLAMSSVISGRRRVRLVPQSGQNYSSGASSGIINILIQDGQAYADLLSACLSFEVTVSETSSTGISTAGVTGPSTVSKCAVLDDGAYSVFRRCLISVNSTLMDDTDFLPKKCNAELYSTVSQNWYSTVGSFLGLWKHSTSAVIPAGKSVGTNALATFDSTISKYDVVNKIVQQSNKVASVGSLNGAPYIVGQNKYSIPLSLLTSFFRNDTLFPSRNAGQLYVQLNLASAVEAILAVNPTAGTISTPGFNITNLTLELDFVDLHPTYLSLMDDMIESPSGAGVNWAFDSHLVATQAMSSGSGTQSIIVSKASQNMRSLQVVTQPSAGLASQYWLSQSTFCNPGFIDAQYRIGSLYYPAFVARGEHRAFMDLQNAFGSPESIDKSGIIDNTNYYANTNTALSSVGGSCTLTQQPAVQFNADGTLATTSLVNAVWSDAWTYAYCFDRLKHAKFHGVDLDGINTLTSAGSQMVVQLNCNPPANYQMTAIVRFTRVLHLGGGATSVIG